MADGVRAVNRVEERPEVIADELRRLDRAGVLLGAHDAPDDLLVVAGLARAGLLAGDARGNERPDVEKRERGEDARTVEVQDVIERAVRRVVGAAVLGGRVTPL